MTALSVLHGEVIRHSQDRAQKFAFETAREKVRVQLDVLVDEPEFIEVFEFVASLGAGTKTYVVELLEFGSRFVNSKHWQLRIQAFTEVNKKAHALPAVEGGGP